MKRFLTAILIALMLMSVSAAAIHSSAATTTKSTQVREKNVETEGFTPIDSSWLKEFKYNKTTHDFYLRLLNGKLYIYHDVPDDVVKGFSSAESHGSYFNANINGQYDYEILDDASDYLNYSFHVLPSKTGATYVVNTNNMKFHKLTCRHAKKITSTWKYTDDTYEELVNANISPCKVCNK